MPVKKPAKKPIKQSKSTSNYNPIVYGVIALLGILLYMYCKEFDFIQDDSFITFRYVKNFTEGSGLVFNIGERVEGYTCFLWVILLSSLKSMGFNFINGSQTLGILSAIITLIFTYLISARFFPKEKDSVYNIVFTLIAAILLTANGSFAYWAVSGMETGLFGMLITLGVFFYLKEMKTSSNIPYSSILFLLAALTRPEGNLIFAVTVFHQFIYWRKHKSESFFNRNNLGWLGAYVIPAAIYMMWRYSYYGYLFPNTFYAKTGASIEYFKAGFDYVVEFAKSYGLYGILLALPFIT